MTRVVHDPASLARLLGSTARGVVPTMGALHDGHLALIRRCAAENPQTVVTIFVNPAQFGDPGDLARYPRTLDRDLELAQAAGATVIYAPSVETVYPSGFQTTVSPGSLAHRWEGEHRPGHFAGVATVVTILLNTVRAERAYFGEKDYQQLCIIRRLHADLRLPGAIVGCTTVRDRDGLALSSRNARLSVAERAIAAAVPRALFEMVRSASQVTHETAELIEIGTAVLHQQPGISVDYLAVVDPRTLEPLARLIPGARALLAVRLGSVRLIDNVELLPQSEGSA